jgi:5-methylcytosine-specific restriction endonuclease McrA
VLRRKPLARVSPKNRVETAAYELVRQRALTRDHGQCQASGKFGVACWGRVEVHHRIPRSRAPELRSSLDNLICLCAGHHSAAHNNPMLAKELGLLG